ncbi:MAG TPA: hypothetical protein LFW21_05485 [Rickettsia endosymbiont of Pyrocoelia pectoralis]|nr:hypothetical protein [Rickettsia endosymbiont of Pyrocoelia pectoralis]
MKLIEYFKKLESIAFGPLLNKYKESFTLKELESDMFDIIIKAQENKDSDKELVILSNDIFEREMEESIIQSKVAAILPLNHKESLYFVFTWLTNFQLEQYSKFILNLPKDYKDYEDYFLQEQQQDGYSKIKAFKEVQDKECLARKYLNSSNLDNYKLFQENTLKLQEYLEYPYGYNTCKL